MNINRPVCVGGHEVDDLSGRESAQVRTRHAHGLPEQPSITVYSFFKNLQKQNESYYN
jgi:hypothetical protein